MILNSYAKLNLYLEVLSKRKDNYHNIKTIFERIDLSDRIILSSRQDKKIKVICNSEQVPKDNTNLCYRSAKLLQDNFKVNQGVDIKIIKRIPVGAGLGGGSSNAAAVFIGLNKLWKLHLSKARLIRLSKEIGSDVAFFIYNISFAQGTGRGEQIRPLKVFSNLRLWHILIVPRIKVSTPHIYRKWDDCRRLERVGLTKPKYNVKILILGLKKKELSLVGKALYNSLEDVSIKLYPQIRRIKDTLKTMDMQSILMSGSGPAVFGIVTSRKEAVSLCRQLKSKDRFWEVFVTRTI